MNDVNVIINWLQRAMEESVSVSSNILKIGLKINKYYYSTLWNYCLHVFVLHCRAQRYIKNLHGATTQLKSSADEDQKTVKEKYFKKRLHPKTWDWHQFIDWRNTQKIETFIFKSRCGHFANFVATYSIEAIKFGQITFILLVLTLTALSSRSAINSPKLKLLTVLTCYPASRSKLSCLERKSALRTFSVMHICPW